MLNPYIWLIDINTKSKVSLFKLNYRCGKKSVVRFFKKNFFPMNRTSWSEGTTGVCLNKELAGVKVCANSCCVGWRGRFQKWCFHHLQFSVHMLLYFSYCLSATLSYSTIANQGRRKRKQKNEGGRKSQSGISADSKARVVWYQDKIQSEAIYFLPSENKKCFNGPCCQENCFRLCCTATESEVQEENTDSSKAKGSLSKTLRWIWIM